MNHVTRRVRLCRMIERMSRDREYAEKLGLSDVSSYKKPKGADNNEKHNK